MNLSLHLPARPEMLHRVEAARTRTRNEGKEKAANLDPFVALQYRLQQDLTKRQYFRLLPTQRPFSYYSLASDV